MSDNLAAKRENALRIKNKVQELNDLISYATGQLGMHIEIDSLQRSTVGQRPYPYLNVNVYDKL